MGGRLDLGTPSGLRGLAGAAAVVLRACVLLGVAAAIVRAVVVGDSNTEPLYAKRVADSLRAAGIEVVRTTIPAGEEGKTLDTVADIWRVFLRADGTPTGLTATNEAGVAVFPEWRHAPPSWSFDPSWDTVRVVSAGPDDADGRVRVEIGPDGTLCVFR